MIGRSMVSADVFMLDGYAHSWRDLRELRRQQMEARKSSKPRQLILFELKEDRRPESERTAAGRYREPTLLDWANGEPP
jgi:hypothetical protein